MKRVLLILFVVALMFTGCSTECVEISPIATAYLSAINVDESRLLAIDFEKISEYESSQQYRNMTYISMCIDEVLKPLYNFKLFEGETISNENVVMIELEIKDDFGTVIHTEPNAKILIGSSFFDTIEQELLHKSKNHKFSFRPDDVIQDFFCINKNSIISITVLEIYDYVEKDDTPAFLTEQGFASFVEFYNYLFEMKTDEYDYEVKTGVKDDFVDYAIGICDFSIPEDDLKNYSQQIVDENIQTAESIGITVEEYYTNLLSLDEDGFFLMCAETAEKEIKKCLIIGALSQHYEIGFDDDYYDSFCSSNNVDISDSTTIAIVKFYCLENAVIEYFTSVKLT